MANKVSLHQVALFKNLSKTHLHQLQSIAEERAFRKNEVVCRLQDSGSLYVMSEGTVKVSMQDRSSKEIILYVVRAGEFFGEAALFGEGCQSGIATALGPCRIFEISRDRFMSLIGLHPGVLLEMLATLSARLSRVEQRISRLVFADAYEKVASLLTDALEETKTPLDAGVEVTLPLSHKELASLVGVSRETFTRVMSGFQKAGVIRIKSRRIAIINPARLKREASRSGHVPGSPKEELTRFAKSPSMTNSWLASLNGFSS